MKVMLTRCLGIAIALGLVGVSTANAAAFYEYKVGNDSFKTLEEAEASIRADGGSGGGLPLLELAFPILSDFFTSPSVSGSLDYRPLGALGTASGVLTFGASTVIPSYRVHVAGWPPSAVAPGCATSACPAGVCGTFEAEVALVQCTFDATWDTRPNYSWTRSGAATSVNQITGAPQSVTGAGQTSGVLNYFPASSIAPGWGSTITINAQSGSGTGAVPDGVGEVSPNTPQSTTQFKWNVQRQDAVTCPSGSGVSSGATSAADACHSEFHKVIVTSPPMTQSPGQCGVGDPCYPSNGNNRATERVFRYGAINFSLNYNSLRTSRVYGYIDRNWSHSFSKRLLTEWSAPGHLTGAETQGVNVATVYVQDDNADVEVFKPSPQGSGTLRSTSAIGKVLIYMPRSGLAPPLWKLNMGNGVVEVYDRAGRLVEILDSDNPARSLSLTYYGGTIDIDAVPSSSSTGPEMQEDFWRIDQIADGSGRYVSFEYSNDSYLWLNRITADDGITAIAEFHFGNDHRLERLTYADSSERTFVYNEPDKIFVDGVTPPGIRGFWLTGILDEDNRRYGTFRYDDHGRVVDNWHGPDSEKIHIDYAAGDMASTVTFPSGMETTFSYKAGEPYRHPESSTNSSGTRGYEYYPTTHRLKKITDANNNVSEREYDTLGIHLTANVEAKGTPEQRRTRFDWDAATNRVLNKRIYTQPNNGTSLLTSSVTFSYNAKGALASLTETDELSGANRATTYGYCASTNVATGCVADRLRTIDGPRTDAFDITMFRYYTSGDPTGCSTANGGECHQLGDLKSATNALGQVFTYVKYDRAGRVVRVRDANNVLTDFVYNVRGWMTDQISRANSDGSTNLLLDAKTHLAYDGSGNVTRVTLPDLAMPQYSLEYSYDAAHRLVGVSDSYGNKVTYALDPTGNRTGETYLNNQNELKRSLARVYDQFGRLQQSLNAGGSPVIRYETPPDSPPAGQSFDGGYDGNGNPVYSVDGLGADTFRVFDPLNRLKTIMQDHSGPSSVTLNATTQLEYDERDHLVSVTDPDNLSTSYVYDGLNNLRSVTSPDTGATVYTPDSAGNRVSQTDARNVTSTYAYDALNRLTSISFLDASQNVTYQYDQPDNQTSCTGGFYQGRLSRMIDESGITTYCYDRRGSVVRKQQDGYSQLVIGYAYDKADRLASITYPSGAIVTYVRDDIGRITTITRKNNASAPSVTIVSNATYLPFGPLSTLTYGNERILTKKYDLDYAIDRVFSSEADGLIIDFTTDILGNIKDASSTLDASSKTRTYFYDRLYRLREVDNGLNSPVEIYGYNATGDRTLKKLGLSPPQPYDYIMSTHRLESVDGVARSYDEVGNTTSRGDGISFSYNARNRLSITTLPKGVVAQAGAVGPDPKAAGAPKNQIFHSYNGRSERVTTNYSLSLQFNSYAYDEAGHHLGAYFGFGDLGTEVIYLGDMPIAITNQGVLSYLETDHLGTPRIAADPATNAQQWKWDFFADAFGDNEPTIAPSGGIDVRLRYPGQYADGFGLNYNYFRDYESGTGRYLESDPIGLEGGLGGYSYAGGNALLFLDPAGLAACTVLFPDYPIDTGFGFTSTNLGGHAGVVSYDEWGSTRYYEYGRYSPSTPYVIGDKRPGSEGNVRRIPVPDLSIDPKTGQPEAGSMDDLKRALEKRAGHNTRAELNCDSNADESNVNDYAEKFARNKDRPAYSWKPWSSNQCRDFSSHALGAGR